MLTRSLVVGSLATAALFLFACSSFSDSTDASPPSEDGAAESGTDAVATTDAPPVQGDSAVIGDSATDDDGPIIASGSVTFHMDSPLDCNAWSGSHGGSLVFDPNKGLNGSGACLLCASGNEGFPFVGYRISPANVGTYKMIARTHLASSAVSMSGGFQETDSMGLTVPTSTRSEAPGAEDSSGWGTLATSVMLVDVNVNGQPANMAATFEIDGNADAGCVDIDEVVLTFPP